MVANIIQPARPKTHNKENTIQHTSTFLAPRADDDNLVVGFGVGNGCINCILLLISFFGTHSLVP